MPDRTLQRWAYRSECQAGWLSIGVQTRENVLLREQGETKEYTRWMKFLIEQTFIKEQK